MVHTVNRIIIDASYDKVFEISNDINRWKDFFDEYTDSKVLEIIGNKIIFQLSHKNNTSWKSYRLLFKDQKFTYAERLDPLFPFQYMKIIWLYREINNSVEMTWIQDFTMDAKAKFNDTQAQELMNKHSAENMKRFKEIIERER